MIVGTCLVLVVTWTVWMLRKEIQSGLSPNRCCWETWWHAGQTHMVPLDRSDHAITEDGDCLCGPTQTVHRGATAWWHVSQRTKEIHR